MQEMTAKIYDFIPNSPSNGSKAFRVITYERSMPECSEIPIYELYESTFKLDDEFNESLGMWEEIERGISYIDPQDEYEKWLNAIEVG